MNGYAISLPIRALAHNLPAQLFLNCTDDELQPHTRKLALPLSLHSFILIGIRDSVPMDNKLSVPKLRSSTVPASPLGDSQNSPRVSETTLSTPQHSSTRLAGE